jgi:ABC-type dipeptide/oligopeptide/nickel transport system permease subunit
MGEVERAAALAVSVAAPTPIERGAGYLWRRFRRNRLAVAALGFLVVVHAAALLAPRLVAHEPETIDLLSQFVPPSREHLLGTDETGRDVFSRLVFGARTSLAVGLAAMVVAMVMGTVLGSVSAFYGGRSTRSSCAPPTAC